MKKYVKFGLAVVCFLGFLGVVYVLYSRLSAEYKPQQNLVVESGVGEQSSQTGNDISTDSRVDAGNGTDADVNKDHGGDTVEQGNGTAGDTEANNGGKNATTDTSKEDASTSESADDTTEEEQSNLAIDFTMENAAGEAVNLYDFVGKPIVLNFWASWCGPCKAEIPDFQETYGKYEGEIEFLMVNMTDGIQETKEGAKEFIQEQGYTLPFYFDTQLQGAYTYGVYSLPMTFFVNADGEMVAYAQGMINAETLEQGISMIYSEN